MEEMTELQKKWAKEIQEEEDLKKDSIDPNKIEEGVLERIPVPTGWRVVVLPYRPPNTTKSGIVLAEKAIEKQQVATVCGYVVEVGNLAYKDPDKFPDGPWCQKGDWVIFARYAGARINIEGGEIRILNDDEILARVKDPEDVLHMV
jgi:co-chaperonin GroES (HSP10)